MPHGQERNQKMQALNLIQSQLLHVVSIVLQPKYRTDLLDDYIDNLEKLGYVTRDRESFKFTQKGIEAFPFGRAINIRDKIINDFIPEELCDHLNTIEHAAEEDTHVTESNTCMDCNIELPIREPNMERL